jgi:hypothetical protein
MELSKPLLANFGIKQFQLWESSCSLLVGWIYSATGEWRFHFAESVPVPINGSNLETQVMADPPGVCHASRLCLPLPYLRRQLTFLPPPWSHHVFFVSVCLPLPGLTGTLPPMKTCSMEPYDLSYSN